jgi:hypothetical protein
MKIKALFLIVCVLGALAAGCGSVDEKQVERILSGVAQTTVAGVTFVPETPGASPDVNVIVQQTFAAMTLQAGGGPLSTPQPAATTGSISGVLNYPAESIPSMYVTAYQTGTQNYQYVITNPGQGTYQIDGLQPGVYHVIAYTVGGGGFPAGLAGGYTQAVLCGLNANCTDHTLINVTVSAGQTASNANPYDWYAPQGTFPPFPQQAGSPTLSTTPMSSFPEMGTITGTLSYPASGIPALRIAAFELSTSEVSYMDTAAGQGSYSFDLPVGTYHVVAYTLGGGGYPSGLAGGYSQAVPCGLSVSCTDHSLINVVVTAGATTANVNPGDWYAPAGTFPPKPGP